MSGVALELMGSIGSNQRLGSNVEASGPRVPLVDTHNWNPDVGSFRDLERVNNGARGGGDVAKEESCHPRLPEYDINDQG